MTRDILKSLHFAKHVQIS